MEVEPFVQCRRNMPLDCSYTSTFTHSPFYLWTTPLIRSSTHRSTGFMWWYFLVPCLSSLAFSISEVFSPWHPGYSNSLFRCFHHWPVHTIVGMSLHMSLSHSFRGPLRPCMALFIKSNWIPQCDIQNPLTALPTIMTKHRYFNWWTLCSNRWVLHSCLHWVFVWTERSTVEDRWETTCQKA